jgi:curved DNA-binding protein CbpA
VLAEPIRSKSTGSVHLARLLRRYALPPQQEREPRSEDGTTSSVARLGIVSTYASLQAANGVDLYKALGITSQASLREIKVAFRQLAKALHPDRNAGDKLAEQQFAAVREAYSILVNTEWRAIYDRELELIRAAAAAQAAEQEAIRIAARRRLILREALKTAAATVILTACLVTGLSIWQRSSSGLQRAQTAEVDAQPPRAHIPATVTSAELADALFGSQASQYGNEAARPSSEATAADNGPQPQSEVVAAGGEPPNVAAGESSEPSAPSNETIVNRTPSAPGDEPPPTTAIVVAMAEPALAHAEVTIATAADPPAQEAALPASPSAVPSMPSKTPDPAARAQAERLVGQGDRQLANGNVAIARQYYARAADLGFAPAAIKLADTFDAKVLARHGVHGVRPNPAEADKWRRRAAELAQ